MKIDQTHTTSSLIRAALAIVISASLLPLAARSQEPVESLRETTTTVREIGVAMFRWSEDNADGVAELAESKRVDIGGIATIDADELAKLIVPRYIEELPRTDSWGRPLEFRMEPSASGPAQLAVRSSGIDGSFGGTNYEIGAFVVGEEPQGHDIVWINGYFVRWPTSPE